MEEFLEFVLKRLIDNPEDLVITKVENPKKITFKLQLEQSDVGKVIGRHGHTISAIRNLLSAAAARHNQRVAIDILEERGEGAR